MNRVRNFKAVLWGITGLAAAVAVTRFWFGLGSVTNLSDATPWGLWIGFDVVSGVALAAGGFVITAVVYILKRKEFYPIVRPAVLTAFLGYLAVIVGLIFDLGLPWNIWQPLFHWQYHSALFEVAMCVMFYTMVLFLEFVPIPLDEAGILIKVRNFLVKLRLPLVILGIMLSTLHQSSLGSLFLLTNYRLHPLWYTPILPILFFISAMGLGLMMVTFESLLTSYLYRRQAEIHLLSKLGKTASLVLAIYLILRFGDLALAGKLRLLVSGDWESYLFMAEVLITFIIPLVLLSLPAMRNSLKGLWACSLMVVIGTVFNRVNVSGFAMQSTVGYYLPSWTEVVISAGVVAAAALAFLFILEKCTIWECRPIDPESALEIIPHFDRFSDTSLGEPTVAGKVKFSLIFIIMAAAGFTLLSGSKVRSEGVVPSPVERARGGDTLFIDGNRNYYGVIFNHSKHKIDNGGDSSCVLCHHMNLPFDKNSPCYICHSDMYLQADALKHDWHASPAGGKLACVDCHLSGRERTALTAKKCQECHKDIFPPGAAITVAEYQAVSYTDAMHGLCIDCHKVKAVEMEGKANICRCPSCHKPGNTPSAALAEGVKSFHSKLNWVVLPAPGKQ